MKAIFVIVAVCAAVAAADTFGDWAGRFNKAYGVEEVEYRRSVFNSNLAEIRSINEAGLTWNAGVNEFSDLTWEEFQAKFLMAPQKCSATEQGNHKMSGLAVAADPALDWRDKGVVTAVKNQGSCGSCWAFSSTGAIESANAIKTGQLVQVAEQQLVDCAGRFNNQGCRGGLPSQAFQYVIYAGGIQSGTDYKYTGRDGTCKFDKTKVIVSLTDEVNITQGNEKELFDAITKTPVSVAYQVASDFRHYSSGVYDSTTCKSGPMDVNHAVLAVGYNSTATKPYYIIKNSWGTSFGIKGYFWMVRNKNMCGVATCAAYPITK